MTTLSLSEQALVLAYAVLFGAAVTVLYGVMLIFRSLGGIRLCPPGKLAEARFPLIGRLKRRKILPDGVTYFLTDVLFFLILTAAASVFLYHANHGKTRWYLLSGAAFGFLFCRFLFGKILAAFAETVAFIVRLFFAYLFFPLRLCAVWGRVFVQKRRLARQTKKAEKQKTEPPSDTPKYGFFVRPVGENRAGTKKIVHGD